MAKGLMLGFAVLGFVCWAGTVLGQDVAQGEDLAKVQDAWRATIESKTLKMVQEVKNVVITQGGTGDADTLESVDTATVQLRNNENGETDIYARVELRRGTVTNAEMVVLNGVNYIMVEDPASGEATDVWISGEEIANLDPANIAQIIDPRVDIEQVEGILKSENVESVAETEPREVNGLSAICYNLTPTPEFQASVNPEAADLAVTNEVCVDGESGKLVKVIGSIVETVTLEDQEAGAPTGLEVNANSDITFSDFEKTFEFPARFTEEAIVEAVSPTTQNGSLPADEDTHDDHDDHGDEDEDTHGDEDEDTHDDHDDHGDEDEDTHDDEDKDAHDDHDHDFETENDIIAKDSASSFTISSALVVGAVFTAIFL